MEHRRLFIMRKDLPMSPGKLAAQVGHCAELYWMNLIKDSMAANIHHAVDDNNNICNIILNLDKDIYEHYVCDIYIKTICQAKNLRDLLKARDKAIELGLVENRDFGLVKDHCLTDLKPENEDGTTTTGIWFKPLPTEVVHSISKKYQLYRY